MFMCVLTYVNNVYPSFWCLDVFGMLMALSMEPLHLLGGAIKMRCNMHFSGHVRPLALVSAFHDPNGIVNSIDMSCNMFWSCDTIVNVTGIMCGIVNGTRAFVIMEMRCSMNFFVM